MATRALPLHVLATVYGRARRRLVYPEINREGADFVGNFPYDTAISTWRDHI